MTTATGDAKGDPKGDAEGATTDSKDEALAAAFVAYVRFDEAVGSKPVATFKSLVANLLALCDNNDATLRNRLISAQLINDSPNDCWEPTEKARKLVALPP